MSEYVMRIAGREYRAQVRELTPDYATVDVDGKEYRVDLVQLARRATAGRQPPADRNPSAPPPVQRPIAPAAPRGLAPGGEGVITAPMPGLVVAIKVKEAEKVQAGQVLLVMEAMKMENAVRAPYTGTVARVFVREGASIGEGDRLIEVARPKLTAL